MIFFGIGVPFARFAFSRVKWISGFPATCKFIHFMVYVVLVEIISRQ